MIDGSRLLSDQEVLEANTMQVIGLPAAVMTFYGDPKNWATGGANDGGEYARTAARNLGMVSEPVDKRIVRTLLVHGDLTKGALKGMGWITHRDSVSAAVDDIVESGIVERRGAHVFGISDASRARDYLDHYSSPFSTI